MLSLAGVSRAYGEQQVLGPLDLDVSAGECVALLGRNGSGKSTLLRLAAGREEPSTGRVAFDGLPMSEDDPHIRSRVAVVGDPPACYPDLTVRQHLELVAVGHRVPEPQARIDLALQTHRLTARAAALPAELSSGQLQEMLLAAALLRPMDLLLLDEPEQRLDPAARERLAARLAERRAAGTTLLLATHHRALARAVADRVLVLDRGVVTAEGPPGHVLPEEADGDTT
ncbi:ABC transporter ATP-binding protein [Streptomyces sp. MP131-18]|uniref:ATP-binding cassette domain-containing protein n=1 Tax=Streptomyces sp. MP131-18 TaxID=1857892 RepID=UPI00209B6CF9|nr:ABC transporter ATP-binding protein [Streptomyces sp. MP131-18]